MGAQVKEKKLLSIKGLLRLSRRCFTSVDEPKKHTDGISIADCLMAGLAIFGLKIPSLLQYDDQIEHEIISHNLKTLYGIQKAASDTFLRERLDNIDPQQLRPAFRTIFAALQRGKVLEEYEFIDGYYLMPCDGTGVFSSEKVHCENCCEKHHKDGRVSYYHQFLAAVIVHPDHKEVFPLFPEAILKQDGAKKNDCERNACVRFLEGFRKEHPHLKVIMTSDALGSNGPNILNLKRYDIRFIIGVKPDGNETLFDWLKGIKPEELHISQNGSSFVYKWFNGIPLNNTYPDLNVNFFECIETTSKGEVKHFTWVTDFIVTPSNVSTLSKGGRARWKIENETFNTLKNQGYHFEHNYGHGYKNLSQVFSILMFLAFLIDQVQQRSCGMFQAALKTAKRKMWFWSRMRALFTTFEILSWSDLYLAIANGLGMTRLMPLQRPP